MKLRPVMLRLEAEFRGWILTKVGKCDTMGVWGLAKGLPLGGFWWFFKSSLIRFEDG